MNEFEKIGKYEIIGKIGQGSFGVVYRGRDPFLKRDVAIKVCSVEDSGLRQRFAREGQISANLQHRNIVTVFDSGFEQDVPYLVQEYLTGEDLSQVIKRQAPLSPVRKIDYLLQVAEGLLYAHSQGVIHRDVKPANIRLLEDGKVKIMDFGIAKLASAETQLTQKGVTMGTASYLPPEQVRGSDVDHRADIFSFGILAYELLTYERPFRGNTLSALVYQILYKVPLAMNEVWADCPPALADLVAKCLEKKPERRFGGFGELVPALQKLHEEVLAGKFPALKKAPTPRPTTGDSVAEDSSVVSQSSISRAAKDVVEGKSEGKVGDATIQIPSIAPPPAIAGLGDIDSTRPIPVTPLPEKPPLERPRPAGVPPRPEAAPPPAAPPPAAPIPPISAVPPIPAAAPGAAVPSAPKSSAAVASTPVMPKSAAPETKRPAPPPPPPVARPASAPAAQAAGKLGGEPPLVERSQEIATLVAQGELEAALHQLEETISERRDASAIGPLPLSEAPTVRTAIPAVPPGTPEREVPAAILLPPPPPPAVTPAPSSGPAAPPPAKIGRGLGKWIALGGTALALLLVVVVAVVWIGRRSPEPAPPPPPPPPQVVEEPAAPPAGSLTVDVRPWAELTEITDARGAVQALPEAPYTPLNLALPPGKYRLSLRLPQSPEVVTCEVEVSVDAAASCVPEAPTPPPSAIEYFKESGWWK